MGMKRILVANRGEIARRVFRTAHDLGMECVAVFSDPDAGAPFVAEAEIAVHLPGTSSTDTYLNTGAILHAAAVSGADAIHPGYGFLSENAEFAQAVTDAGYTWIGSTPESIRAMALKIEAKALAEAAGVPLAPGATLPESMHDDELVATCDRLGYPLLIKASAGGGGKGMRIVSSAGEVLEAVSGARREALNSFGDATVFAEAYLTGARHVEVQVFGDQHGNVVHLFERECSIQRRHQKVVEEAPSAGITEATRQQLFAAATQLTRHIGYVGAGTVEFMVFGEGDDQRIAFLEMNTRLQVEHPVTEAITGLDLVAWQIAVAEGKPLPLTQEQITTTGHAVEVRLYAEDPANADMPATGTFTTIDTDPAVLGVPGLRIDSGVESGSVVSPYYDPMLAKIIAWGADRDQAAARLVLGMRRMRLHGPTTNRDALVAIIESQPFHFAQTTTAFLDEHPHLRSPQLPEGTADRHVIAAALAPALDTEVIAGVASGWRNVPAVPEHRAFRLRGHDDVTTVSSSLHRGRWHIAIDGQASEEPARQILDVQVALVERDAHSTMMDLEIDGVRTRLRVQRVGAEAFVDDGHSSTAWIAQPRFATTEGQAANMNPQAPVPGTVTAIEVQPGDQVQAGQTLVIVEAMKMEHRITAPTDGRVTQVRVSVGQAVDAHQVLVDVEDVE
jgi:propionyl-CoA carboxylase alpha chain